MRFSLAQLLGLVTAFCLAMAHSAITFRLVKWFAFSRCRGSDSIGIPFAAICLTRSAIVGYWDQQPDKSED